MPRIAGIGLGSNLGDRAATIARALQLLEGTPDLRIATVSELRETAPVGPPQPRYLNGAARIETSLSARALLDRLLTVERALGRERGERWGPRTIDLDLLVMLEPDGRTLLELDEPGLTVPHPRLLERAFALGPLLEVVPELAPRWGSVLWSLELP